MIIMFRSRGEGEGELDECVGQGEGVRSSLWLSTVTIDNHVRQPLHTATTDSHYRQPLQTATIDNYYRHKLHGPDQVTIVAERNGRAQL